MLIDRYSFQHSTSSTAAVAAFEQVVSAVAAHQPAAAPLQTALAHDPQMAGALALKGIAAVIMASDKSMRLARELCIASETALNAAPNGGTRSERALVEAHWLAAHGKLNTAAARLEQHLQTAPRDFLATKLAHALRFMSGETAAMLATTSEILPHWNGDAPGFGYLMGCHAFSLEETGSFAEAETAGRIAVDYAPDDVWALHAVAHVMEMRGRLQEGIAWLKPTTSRWSSCGNFGGHLAWHLALFHLSAGDHTSALGVFDTHLQTAPTCDFRDVANATSLLWRLEQEGINVGNRWEAVGHIAYERRCDTAYVFGAMHSLLALIGSRQFEAARELVAALKQSAVRADSDQALVSEAVGIELAETILAMAEQSGGARKPLSALALRLPRLGGSVAQRDVFLRTLLLIAAEMGDQVNVAKLKALRLRQRHQDKFLVLVEKRQSNSRLSQQIRASA